MNQRYRVYTISPYIQRNRKGKGKGKGKGKTCGWFQYSDRLLVFKVGDRAEYYISGPKTTRYLTIPVPRFEAFNQLHPLLLRFSSLALNILLGLQMLVKSKV